MIEWLKKRIYRPCPYTYRVDIPKNMEWLHIDYFITMARIGIDHDIGKFLYGQGFLWEEDTVKKTNSWLCRNTIRLKKPEWFKKQGKKNSIALCRYNLLGGRDIYIKTSLVLGNDGDIINVIAHEMGHAVGLDHTDDAKCNMYPYQHSDNTGRIREFKFYKWYRFPWLLLNLFRRW